MNWYKPRLNEIYRVLKETGSAYIQCDYRLIHYLKIEMDNIFGIENFKNEIIWWYKRWSNVSKNYQRMHDTILFYTKSKDFTFNIQYQEYSKPETIEKTIRKTIDGKLQRVKDENGNYIERQKENKGVPLHDVWELQHIQPTSKERIGYDTQKPKILLERIIKSSSNQEDIVADFFMGSGTTGEVALELGRKFIGCDIGEKACKITKGRLDKIVI